MLKKHNAKSKFIPSFSWGKNHYAIFICKNHNGQRIAQAVETRKFGLHRTGESVVIRAIMIAIKALLEIDVGFTK